MGLLQADPKPTPTETSRPLQVLQTLSRPLVESSKKYYKDEPQEFLQLVLTFAFILFTFLIQFWHNLPWQWYAMVSVWIILYFQFPKKIHQLIKKKHK